MSEETDADDHLESYVASLERDASTPAPKDSEPRAIGQGPPCAKYQQLMTIASWRILLKELHECEDAQSFKHFSKDFPKPRLASVDLTGAAKRAIKELGRLIKQEEEAAAQRAPKSKKVETPLADDKMLNDLMALLAEEQNSAESQVTSIKSLEYANSKEDSFSLNEPFMIIGDIVKNTLKGTKLMASLSFNQTRFNSDPKVDVAKGGSGRGQVAPKSEVMQTEIVQTFKTFFGPLRAKVMLSDDICGHFKDDWPPAEQQELKASMLGNIFGLMANQQFSGWEKHI